MSRNLIPYGLLANGNYGVLLDPTTRDPLASVVEVLPTLPAVSAADNFNGRLVFDVSTTSLSIYVTTPTPYWKPLEGIPATVASVAGNPPVIPVPATGGLLWDLDTQVLFLWDGSNWQPAGGLYAAQIIENSYIGDGVTTNYPTGSSVVVSTQYVEVFLDGVRQTAITDYNVVGTNISFIIAPPNAIQIYVRTMASAAVIQNAQVAATIYTAIGGQTDFTSGQAGSDPAGVFVYVDGVLQTGTGVDYTFIQQDTSIVSIVKTSPTVALVTTTLPHFIPVGASVTLGGLVEPEYNNQSFIVSTVLSPTTFEIPVLITDPVSGTGNPIMFFGPLFVNDVISFTAPMVGGESVDIRSLKNVIVGSSTGEVNTLASVGTGVGIESVKAGSVLQMKSLKSGANVSITDLGNEIEIAASTGSGFEDRVGINVPVYNVINTISYVGVRNTSFPVTIDLSGILQIPTNSGRRVTIKDESGGAGTIAIQIVATPSLIEGVAAPYVINNNHGSVTLVMDGNNWYVTATV